MTVGVVVSRRSRRGRCRHRSRRRGRRGRGRKKRRRGTGVRGTVPNGFDPYTLHPLETSGMVFALRWHVSLF